jgi:hypothetical protein
MGGLGPKTLRGAHFKVSQAFTIGATHAGLLSYNIPTYNSLKTKKAKICTCTVFLKEKSHTEHFTNMLYAH